MAPPFTTMDSLIKVASTLAHQGSGDVAVLVIYPSQYAGMNFSTCLTARRRIEDVLMKAQLDIETEIQITAHIPDAHPNDRRKLGMVARLCISERVGKDSVWWKSEASLGKIESVPLIRNREMRVYVPLDADMGSAESRKLPPAERAIQKGPAATEHILTSLIAGVGQDGNRSFLVVDLNAHCSGDWAHGVLAMQLNRKTTDPLVGYLGFLSEVGHLQVLRASLETALLETWWPKQPEAGPDEPTSTAEQLVDRPSLILCSWSGGLPVLPACVSGKFSETDAFFSDWTGAVGAFSAKLSRWTAAVGGPERRMPESTTQLTGPDWRVHPVPKDMTSQLELTAADVDQAAVCPAWSKCRL